jgi:hypothetical protein
LIVEQRHQRFNICFRWHCIARLWQERYFISCALPIAPTIIAHTSWWTK